MLTSLMNALTRLYGYSQNAKSTVQACVHYRESSIFLGFKFSLDQDTWRIAVVNILTL